MQKITVLLKIKKANYDIVAPFYDRLSHLIFGDAVLQSQVFLVDAIPANSALLIIGGGTGYLLEEIFKKHATSLQITYVDISKKMIDISKRRNAGNNEVIFINQSVTDASFTKQFDVVITPFFLDNFSNKSLEVIHNKINVSLKPGGLWLFADFQQKENKLWQKLLLNVMYFFFRFVCNIEAAHLEDYNALFKKSDYKIVSAKTFFNDFICAVIYQKS